ncbi:hypothetical protein Y032_0096g2925 [Ancylostoma ceylanicum]|uniref:Uncharacterized protein n=1 Tax=Ancylostoma ceylanicum TaxID=53326 RepID=A0A016TJF6_9BILA|nr:hypothetical protein Y032_0096g2925 [Ancylostoma ceylanicum]
MSNAEQILVGEQTANVTGQQVFVNQVLQVARQQRAGPLYDVTKMVRDFWPSQMRKIEHMTEVFTTEFVYAFLRLFSLKMFPLPLLVKFGVIFLLVSPNSKGKGLSLLETCTFGDFEGAGCEFLDHFG